MLLLMMLVPLPRADMAAARLVGRKAALEPLLMEVARA
jgi:hypothetical protein